VLLLLALPLKLLLDLPADAFGGEPANARKYILEQLGLATAGFFGVVHMVNVMGDYCRRKKQTGQDLCKKGTPLGEVHIPESQGLAPGIIYLMIIIACQMLYTQSPESLVNYNSSLLSICFMLFLGFVDDVLVRTCVGLCCCERFEAGGSWLMAVSCVCVCVFLPLNALSPYSHTLSLHPPQDLPWRYKLILPPIATLPLLCSYSGSTSVIIPKPLRSLLWSSSSSSSSSSSGGLTGLGQLLSAFVTVDAQARGKIVELGLFFMIYMALLAVFCTNAINIYAGINGLEAGQSLVIGVGILVFKLWEILYENDGKGRWKIG
jgi:UDP-N-acetylglucosamine--dolichyl-phosphate N-acetylglucosaminephosphotransferase